MSESEPSREVKRIVRRPPRQYCVKTQIWGRIQEPFRSIESAQEHSSLHHSQMEEIWNHQVFLDLASLREIGGRALVRQVTKNPIGIGNEIQSSFVEMGEGQPSVQRSTNQSFMLELSGRSYSSIKGTCQPTGSLPKST